MDNVDKTKKVEKKELSIKAKILRTLLVTIVISGLIVLAYYILVWTGVWEYINTTEKLQDVILSWGFWGRLGFIFIQFLQVTLLPLPSTVTIVAGSYVYGPLQGALLSLAGILVGSLFAFFLGRVFGKKVVAFMVGEKTCDKWTKFLTDAKYSFVIMMLLPVFPDDVLCLVAGLTNMTWGFFTITNLVARPLGIFMVSYLGSGQIIPYYGWGLIVWAVIGVLVIAALILSYKYRNQIENFLLKIFKNKNKKEKAEKLTTENKGLKNNELQIRVEAAKEDVKENHDNKNKSTENSKNKKKSE